MWWPLNIWQVIWHVAKSLSVEHAQVITQLLLALVATSGVLAAIAIPIFIRNDEKVQQAQRECRSAAGVREALLAELEQVRSDAKHIAAQLDFFFQREEVPFMLAAAESDLQMMDIPRMPLLSSPEQWCLYLEPEQSKAVSQVNAAIEAFRRTKAQAHRPDVSRFLEKMTWMMNVRAEKVATKADAAIDSLYGVVSGCRMQ